MRWLSCVVVAFLAVPAFADGPVNRQEARDVDERFEELWKDKLVWRFADLPTKGNVPRHRMPYSGAIYPDNAGGTLAVMRKYDQAFHRGRDLAARYEEEDIRRQQSVRFERGGWFGRRSYSISYMPHWSGHCNGWTAAAIRHAEPQKSVTRNGVTFRPAEIKALLAELYTYSDTVFLGGVDRAINPAIFHVSLTNWLGRKKYPVGLEAKPDREVWNFPIYSYAYSSALRSRGRRVEVRLNVAHKMYTNREYDKSPATYRLAYYHYMLDLDREGRITGGSYFPDSAQADMLWVPLPPAQGGEPGNERGNPHLDVDEVLAIWRDSVPEDVRTQWVDVEFGATPPAPPVDAPPAAKPDEASEATEGDMPSETTTAGEAAANGTPVGTNPAGAEPTDPQHLPSPVDELPPTGAAPADPAADASRPATADPLPSEPVTDEPSPEEPSTPADEPATDEAEPMEEPAPESEEDVFEEAPELDSDDEPVPETEEAPGISV